MREVDGYRQMVEWLNEKTNGKAWLTTSEIANLLQIDRHTVVRRFGINKGCALPILAKKLCEEST